MSGKNQPLQDPEAFCRLYSRGHLFVFRYIYGLRGGPVEEVEDLTAETFTRAWKARRRFEGDEDAALGWLLRIARTLVIDAHRRRRSGVLDADLEDLEIHSPAAGPEDQVAVREQVRLLLRLVEDLPTEQREMIVLRYMLDWPIKQIAAQMDMLENTVTVTIKRTLEKIRKKADG